jgi:p-hydroxybenzoate 3-monooxygenase
MILLAVDENFVDARLGLQQRSTGFNTAGAMALRRVWSSVRISWYLTNLVHRFPGASDFDQRAREYELEYLNSSHYAQVALAEQHAGLPF